MQRRLLAAIVALAALLSPLVTLADNREVPPVPDQWVSKLDRDHSLVGKIYATALGDFVPAQDFGRGLALARFVLLGEVHDNPDHHLWQAWGIRTVSKLRGSRIVEGQPQIDIVALEMIRVDQLDALDRFYGRNVEVPRPRPAKSLGRMLDWDKSGWPDFKMYEPVVEQAMYEQLVIVPASPSRDLGRRVSKDWDTALSQDEITRLGLEGEFAPELHSALVKEIRDSHCGLIPETAFKAMSRVQRFRDATMADSLLSVGSYKGAVLIAGNGHVRRDRGVPYFLRARGIPDEQIVSVSHVEVNPSESDPAAYVSTAPDGKPAVDFVVFTPRTERADPCEKMRAGMRKDFAKPSTDSNDSQSLQDAQKPGP